MMQRSPALGLSWMGGGRASAGQAAPAAPAPLPGYTASQPVDVGYESAEEEEEYVQGPGPEYHAYRTGEGSGIVEGNCLAFLVPLLMRRVGGCDSGGEEGCAFLTAFTDLSHHSPFSPARVRAVAHPFAVTQTKCASLGARTTSGGGRDTGSGGSSPGPTHAGDGGLHAATAPLGRGFAPW